MAGINDNLRRRSLLRQGSTISFSYKNEDGAEERVEHLITETSQIKRGLQLGFAKGVARASTPSILTRCSVDSAAMIMWFENGDQHPFVWEYCERFLHAVESDYFQMRGTGISRSNLDVLFPNEAAILRGATTNFLSTIGGPAYESLRDLSNLGYEGVAGKGTIVWGSNINV